MPETNVAKILVVDDEAELKNALVEALSAHSFEVRGFTSGTLALSALREEAFDVLISDLMMPEMDGVALIEKALEIDPHLVPIIMTGQGTIQTAVDAMKIGAFDYVLKPFRLATMLPTLTRAINARRLRLENMQLRETVAIYELCQTIAMTLDEQALISKLADAALQQTEADEVSILLPTSNGEELYVAAVRGKNRQRLLGERVPLEESISGWVVRQREPLLLTGEVNDARFQAFWPNPEIKSALSIPMQAGNKLIGTININALNRARPFTLGQMKALTILASAAAAALESASLYRQVQQAEEKYRSIFENAIEGIFQTTPEGRFITVNPSLARIMGYDGPQEMITAVTTPEQFYVNPESRIEAARIENEEGVLRGFEFQAYRKDGTKIWLSGNRHLVRNDADEELYREGSVTDITERKRAEAERLVMFEIIQGVITTTNLDELLKLIHDSISKLLYAENFFVALHDKATDLIHFEYWDDKFDPVPPPRSRGKGFASYVLRTNQPLLLTEELKLRMYASGEVEKSGRSSTSWLGVPLRISTGAIGVLVIQHYEKQGVYGQRDLEVLSSVGDQVALAIERKWAEEALRESEERYKGLIDSAFDGVLILRDRTIVSANRAYAEMFGYSVAEIIGQDVLKFTAPEDRDFVLNQIAQTESTYESVGIRGDGVRIPIEVSGQVCLYKGQTARLAAVRDISERKQAEEIQARRATHALFRADVSAALAVSRVPLRTTLASCAEAMVRHLGAAFARVWTLNREGDMLELQASSGMYTHINGPHGRVPVGMYKIGKIAQERTPHITNEVLTDPRVGDKEWARRERMVAFAGYPLMIEDRLLGVMAMFSRQKLTEDTLDAMASVADVISQGIERKRAEQELSKSEERYRDLVENAHDIIYSHDLEGNYTSMNKAAQLITGYTPEEALTMNLSQMMPAEYLPTAQEMIDRKLAGEKVTAYETELIAKDGHRVAVEANTKLVFQDGVPVGVQGIARDVTDRKLLEEQFRQSQKMEAIGQLAGGVAHDFNNLLTAISGYTSLSLQRLDEHNSVRPYLEEVKKAGDRAANLTRQLLAFGRKQILQPIPLDLNGTVSDMSKMLRRLIGEDIDLSAKLASDLKPIKADPGQIEQVLMNLVVNARDAMPQGGRLTIETANVELDREYTRSHVGTQPGNYVMLAVSDTGIGMSEDTRARIFEPFFTTKEKGKGTGLGLSTVYGIVQQSGGSIWVYSEPNQGTSFKIYLPRLEAPLKANEERPALEIGPRGSETVLLVEDEEVVRGLATHILEDAGYKVLAARGGAEAIQLCAQPDEKIDLLLTDVVMPEISGKEVADRVTALVPDLKVLFMSGYTDEAIVHHGVLDSNVKFIQKPFTPLGLSKKVREVLDSNGHTDRD